MVIKVIKTAKSDRSDISSILRAIKGKFHNFMRVNFRYIPRTTNSAMHVLAREG